MPGLVPGIHAVQPAQSAQACAWPIRVDGRSKSGHDGLCAMAIVRKDV